MKFTLANPNEYSYLTAAQKAIHARLLQKGWRFSMLYHRSAYYRPSEKVRWPDGTVHRIDGSWRLPGIKVFPSGRIIAEKRS